MTVEQSTVPLDGVPDFALGRPPDRTEKIEVGRNSNGWRVWETSESWDYRGPMEIDGSEPCLTYEVVRRNDGSVSRVVYESGGINHRVGGPAVTHYDEHGAKVTEDCYDRGRAHRIDGPAAVEYGPGGVIAGAYYFYENDLCAGPAALVELVLRREEPGDIAAVLRAGSLGRFLDAGHRPDEILAVVAAGILTSEGFTAVLTDGAPTEWAYAFERGAGHAAPQFR